MMQRRAMVGLLGLLALGAACRKREELKVGREEAQDIPREVALQKLRDLLPTAEYAACTAPKDGYKAAEVREWSVGADVLRIVPLKERDPVFAVAYADIRQVRLDKIGKTFQVRLFAPAQADPAKDFLSFTWKNEEAAKQVVELLEALRLKK